MNNCFRLIGNIVGEDFSKMLYYLFSTTTHFSLKENGFEIYRKSVLHRKIVEDLAPFLEKEAIVDCWYGYCPATITNNVLVRDANSPEFHAKEYIFKTDSLARSVLLSYFDNIFLADDEGGFIALEDLCFFSENKLVVGTVSHADLCHIYPRNDEDIAKIAEIGIWKEDFEDINWCREFQE